MLKWPNDVLVGGGKISGVLIEQLDEATIMGIGVNIAHEPAGTPYPATSLARERGGGLTAPSVETCRNALLAAFATWLDTWLNAGFGPIRAGWLVPEPTRWAHPCAPVRETALSPASITMAPSPIPSFL